MNETVIELIKIGVVVLATIISVGVGFKFRRSAKAHEQQAERLDEKVKQAVGLRRA